jgi:MFS family permease
MMRFNALLLGCLPMALGLIGKQHEEALVQAEASPEVAFFSKENINMYTMTAVPLGLVTLILAWMTRPKADDNMPPEFRKFMWVYLTVWYIAVAADWLQGPYVYALYAAYGFSGHQIAQLFVAGFGASMVFGTFVGSLADSWGRKRCCILYCILYILSCMTKHFNNYAILMVGRVTGGVATSILFSCFESWMVSEHFARGFSNKLLKYMFTMMFFGMYVTAIFSGIIAQFLVDVFPMQEVHSGLTFHVGGYNTPFDLSILCLLICLIPLMMTWGENHGVSNSSGSSTSGLGAAVTALFSNWRIASMGVVVSAFEGSMFAFVFNWTPVLESKSLPPPHGLIFALFMMACMCGASCFSLFCNNMKPLHVLIPNLGIAMGSLCMVALAVGLGKSFAVQASFFSFLIFEFCVGVYWPAVGTIKSEVVPEGIRATMYNLYRVPLNAVVCGILLNNFSLGQAFSMCTMLLAISCASTLPMLWAGTSALPKSLQK